ncbi:hypothetical protein IH785_17595, partial [candidate division KSB1 bacterium]|nr:hypothetical protein [candidate division KSB1 bacterium]
EMIRDEVAIIDKGKIIRRGTVEEHTSPAKTFRIQTSKVTKNLLNGLEPHTIEMDQQNSAIQVTVASQKKLNAIIDHLRANDIDIKGVVPHKQSLEESFIEILKKDIVEE